MKELIRNGIDVNNGGCLSDRTVDEAIEAVEAHGHCTASEAQEYSNMHYNLWCAAEQLADEVVRLRVKLSEAESELAADAERKPTDAFTIRAQVELYVGDVRIA